MSIKQIFKATQIIYFALFMGQTMVAVIFYFLIMENTSNEASILNYIAAFITIGTISASIFLHKMGNKGGIELKDDLIERLKHFRTFSIIRWAMLEGGNIAILVFMFIEQNPFYLVFFTFGIGAFILARPTVDSIIKDYKLPNNMESELRSALRE